MGLLLLIILVLLLVGGLLTHHIPGDGAAGPSGALGTLLMILLILVLLDYVSRAVSSSRRQSRTRREMGDACGNDRRNRRAR